MKQRVFQNIQNNKLLDVYLTNSDYYDIRGSSRLEMGGICLVFESGSLVIENPFVLIFNGQIYQYPDESVYEILKNSLNCIVTASYSNDDALVIKLDNEMQISISLKDDDFRGPEAAAFTSNDGSTIIVFE